MAEVGLQRARVMSPISERVTASVPQHVRVGLERQLGHLPARWIMRAKPRVLNSAPRSEVNTKGDLGRAFAMSFWLPAKMSVQIMVVVRQEPALNATSVVRIPETQRLRLALNAVRRGAAKESFVCATVSGRRWHRRNFTKAVRRVAKAAGLPDDLQIRDLHRTAATEGASAGATPAEMMAVGRWANAASIRPYLVQTREQAAAFQAKRDRYRNQCIRTSLLKFRVRANPRTRPNSRRYEQSSAQMGPDPLRRITMARSKSADRVLVASPSCPVTNGTKGDYEFSSWKIWIRDARRHFRRSYALQDLVYIGGYGFRVPEILVAPI